MVKPGGTGSPSTELISARFAPLPPRRSFCSIGGRLCLWSNPYTKATPQPYAAPRRCVHRAPSARTRNERHIHGREGWRSALARAGRAGTALAVQQLRGRLRVTPTPIRVRTEERRGGERGVQE